MLSARLSGNTHMMKKPGLSAVRIGWVSLMLGGACTGQDIDFSSQTGGKGASPAAGSSSFEGNSIRRGGE